MFYDQCVEATMSASRDPRQRNFSTDRQFVCGEDVRTPKALPAETYDLSQVRDSNNSSMFDFDDLEIKSPSEQTGHDAAEYRGEDARERYRLAELRLVQEAF